MIKLTFLGYNISFQTQVTWVWHPCQTLTHGVRLCHTKVPWIWHHLANPNYLGLLVSNPYSLGMASPTRSRSGITYWIQVTWVWHALQDLSFLGLVPLLDPSSWDVAVSTPSVILLLFFNNNNIFFKFINNYINTINNNENNNNNNNNNNNF